MRDWIFFHKWKKSTKPQEQDSLKYWNFELKRKNYCWKREIREKRRKVVAIEDRWLVQFVNLSPRRNRQPDSSPGYCPSEFSKGTNQSLTFKEKSVTPQDLWKIKFRSNLQFVLLFIYLRLIWFLHGVFQDTFWNLRLFLTCSNTSTTSCKDLFRRLKN